MNRNLALVGALLCLRPALAAPAGEGPYDVPGDFDEDDGGFLEEKDIQLGIACRPKRKARIVVNDVNDRICPDKLAWWYPEKKDHIDVRDCYQGQDVWMGPFGGKLAHGGLDINMKSGTLLFAPISFEDHYLFDSLKKGDNNNRWRGIREWDNGAVWWLQAHHLNKMLLPAYELAQPTYRLIAALKTFNDFRPHRFLRGTIVHGQYGILEVYSMYIRGVSLAHQDPKMGQQPGVTHPEIIRGRNGYRGRFVRRSLGARR